MSYFHLVTFLMPIWVAHPDWSFAIDMLEEYQLFGQKTKLTNCDLFGCPVISLYNDYAPSYHVYRTLDFIKKYILHLPTQRKQVHFIAQGVLIQHYYMTFIISMLNF